VVSPEQVTAIATRAARGHGFGACVSGAFCAWWIYECAFATGSQGTIASAFAGFFALAFIGRLLLLKKARMARRAAATHRWYVRRGQLVAVDPDGIPDPAYNFRMGRADRHAFMPSARVVQDRDHTPDQEA
jgi:hypothetical protein